MNLTSIRAKFKCTSVTTHEGGSETVKLSPVNGPAGTENAQWSKYTPAGDITMCITAEGAVGQFQAGKSYFVDFSPVESSPA